MMLSDEILGAALRVDDLPVPATLRGHVRAAVADAGRPRRWSLPDLRILAATGLAVVAFVVTIVFVGSRLPQGPAQTAPVATVPAAVATLEATSVPSPTLTPMPTPVRTPAATDAAPSFNPDAEVIQFAQFAQHVEFVVNRFAGVSGSHAIVIEQGYNAGDALLEDAYLRDEWIRSEEGWMAEHAPQACFAPRFTAWVDTVNAMTEQLLHGTGTAEELLAAWSPAREAVENFDTSIGLTGCTAPFGPDVLGRHINSSIATFTPLADAFTGWLNNRVGPFPRELTDDWIAAESAFSAENDPADCLTERWTAWQVAVADVQDSIEEIDAQTAPDTSHWLAAAEAIETFDPTEGFDCTPPTATPPPVAQPGPLETPVSVVATLAEFQEHLDYQLAEFADTAPAIDRAAAGPATGDAGELLRTWGDAYGLPRNWIDFERTWLGEFESDTCYADAFAAWVTLVDDFEAFHDSISGYQPVIDTDAWEALKARFAEFDGTAGADC